jgi:predicted nucleic acid-binding Zn ribbon protein
VRFGTAIRRLVAERGWEDTTTAAGVLANWDRLVGPEIADHCRPESLLDGVLVLVAESTAWATQLRLMTGAMRARLRDQVGADVVTSIVVKGPAQPDWRRGPRRVQGPGARGPRDTYG